MRRLEVSDLPQGAVDAAAAFMAAHLAAVRSALAEPGHSALAIILPPAPYDHRDWRVALARDLAREAAPVRVNVVAGEPGEAREALLAYIARAPGVTGQYCESHE